MKDTLKFIWQLAYFTMVSVPLACCLFLSANLYYETKKLMIWLNAKLTH